mgnify:CR=1 FL=1
MIIIRKPKFMRSSAAMWGYLTVAKSCAVIATNSLKNEDKLYWMDQSGMFINKAAKAGGFFRVKDMCKYLDQQKLKEKRS